MRCCLCLVCLVCHALHELGCSVQHMRKMRASFWPSTVLLCAEGPSVVHHMAASSASAVVTRAMGKHSAARTWRKLGALGQAQTLLLCRTAALRSASVMTPPPLSCASCTRRGIKIGVWMATTCTAKKTSVWHAGKKGTICATGWCQHATAATFLCNGKAIAAMTSSCYAWTVIMLPIGKTGSTLYGRAGGRGIQEGKPRQGSLKGACWLVHSTAQHPSAALAEVPWRCLRL